MLLNYFIAHVIDFGGSYWLQFLFVTVLLTFLLLLFGEIMPKVYAGQHPLSFCRRAVSGIMFFRKLCYPFASILIKSGILADKMVRKESHVLSVDDLEQALELTDKDDIREEKRMLEGIVRFGDETAKEIMTSRQDVVDLDFKASFAEVLRCIVANNYSRIPVYQDNSDNVRGILYIKDLLPHLSKGSSFRWQSLIRPPYFVPETKKIDDLLREFEYDEDEKNYVRVNANTFVFEGKTLLSDFYKILHVDDDIFEEVEGDADTIAGLLLEIKGDFPKLHEKIEYKNFTFEILDMEERRISKVKVIIHAQDTEETK